VGSTGAVKSVGDFADHIDDEGGVDGGVCKNHHKERDG